MENMDSILKFTLKALKSRTSVTTAEPEVSKTNGKDMLSRWLAAKLNDRDIIVHTSVNVGAGSDTTAIALRAIIYLLLRNPDKSKKLLDQIDQADREGKLSDPVSYKEVITNIPYMDPVMKEAMRLHPSVGLMLERIVPPGGVQLAGRYIPTGTIVGMNAWVLHHDASVYPDPEAFIPERWIENSPERLKQMEQSFFVFGSGSRTCIGKNISLMEMTKLIPQMLREFTIELTHPEREWKTKNIWFVQQEGLICNLKRRTK
jgi:cytochrome P450